MFSDFKFIVFWWLNIFGLSLLTLPFIFLLFRKFIDKGYIFSKIFSIALITYFIFVLGVIHLLPFTVSSIFLICSLIVLADIYLLFGKKMLPEFKEIIKTHYRLFIIEELLFFLVLVAWSFVRGFAPSIEGLEKYMDWGFVNSALRSTYMPPADMWFAGEPINYYYFGHLMFALLTKLSGISSAITYNLAIATVCALAFVSAFSVSANLVFQFQKNLKNNHSKPFSIFLAGLISALLLTFGGNLHTVYKITRLDMSQNKGRLVLTVPAIQKAADAYWYPDATRFIGFDPDVKDKTIHEFPVYSFVVADLHGHMNDIPVVLFFIAVIFSLSLSVDKSLKKFSWTLILLPAFLLSVAYMTNAWDFAVYGLSFGVFYFIYGLINGGLAKSFYYTFVHGFLIIIFWYLFSLPFSLNFIPMVEGLRWSDAHTPFYQLFVLYGGFWLIIVPFIFLVLSNIFRRKNISASDIFAFSLFITATILVIIPEIGYVKDIYIYEHRRANTMFKLVYEAFMMYALVSGYVVTRLVNLKNRLAKNIFRIIFVLVFAIHMIYPYFAIKSYYGLKTYQGIYGLNYLKNSYPDNYNAILWMNKNIQGQPVILEAVGDSYTTFNQVSVATGLPTIEGWIVHEWLWRGGYDRPAARQAEVQKVYEAVKSDDALPILQKYNVRYIFVGDKEREKYPKLNEKIFPGLGAKIVFESGDTRVYGMP